MLEYAKNPEILSEDKAHAKMAQLSNHTALVVVDAYEGMKAELKKTLLFGKNEREQEDYLRDIKPIWVYYPWSNTMVKSLPEKEFIAVRTSRNRYKITQDEQNILANKKVGVVGLSVGRTVSTTLALERICGELRIADFDELELSNLNRLKAPLAHYNLLKTHSTQREIHEFDPFLKVRCFDKGLNSENLDQFFTDFGDLDLVIDECDSLEMKIKLRQKAKELKIPVIMDTSDRGMIDIERYDQDPSLKLFNGLIGDFNPPQTWKITQEERQQLLFQILDFNQISERGKKSLSEVGKSISTWPQLATAVTIGGGVASEISRRILLDEAVPSGRFYIDIEELIPNGERR